MGPPEAPLNPTLFPQDIRNRCAKGAPTTIIAGIAGIRQRRACTLHHNPDICVRVLGETRLHRRFSCSTSSVGGEELGAAAKELDVDRELGAGFDISHLHTRPELLHQPSEPRPGRDAELGDEHSAEPLG